MQTLTNTSRKEAILQSVRSELMMNYKYLARIISSCKYKISDRQLNDYGSSDDTTICLDDSFFGLPKDNKNAVLLHLILHIAFRHSSRMTYKNKAIYETACDLIINHLIESNTTSYNPVKLPKDYVSFRQREFGEALDVKAAEDWDVESLYNWLMQRPKVESITNPHLNLVPSDSSSGQEQAESNRELEDLKWADLITKAGSEAGTDSNNIFSKFKKHIKENKIAWNKQLRKLAREALQAKTKLCYSRPHRHYLAGVKHYEPSRVPIETIKTLVVIVDTSGSCFTEEILNTFCSEVIGIHRLMKCDLIILGADVQVASRTYFKAGDRSGIKDLILNLRGGGGTSFEQPIAEALTYKPSCIIYLTDGHSYQWGNAGKVPTIWCIDSDVKAPYGRTLKLE